MFRSLTQLVDRDFDILIIGGGITGACLAWDAVNRGLSVALIDKNDFGAETSAASSKLLHGGIRYLQQGRIDKVRESALERVYYQKLAPQLSRYVPFVVPTYKGFLKSKFVLVIGMLVYQLICLGQNRLLKDNKKKVPRWQILSRARVSDSIPALQLQDITGGVLFYESHMQSTERMTLAFIASAAKKGGIVANYVRADTFVRTGNTISGLNATDRLTGDTYRISARCIVNAAGPWIPLLNENLSRRNFVTAFSKGAHIVTDRIIKDAAIALATKKQNTAIINRGGRHVFIIPWRNHSLIGTTYDPFTGKLDDIRPTEDDIRELISDINSQFGREILKRDMVHYSYAGIYPLIDDEINTRIYQGTGEYQIIDHAITDNVDGLVTVFGAKFTTARLLAEKALNEISRRFDKPLKPCQTRYTPLCNGDISDIGAYREQKRRQYKNVLGEETIHHLITYYGTEIDQVLSYVQQDPKWSRCLSRDLPDIEAQAIYAAEQEMICHLDDFIFRRTGLGTLGYPGDDVLARCNAILAEPLHWDEPRQLQEIERVKKYYQHH